MTSRTFDQLRKLNVTDDQHLKLEFFFYTDTPGKAGQLATEMERLSYEVKHGVSEGDQSLFIVTGWTTKMKMSDEIVRTWTNKMCEIGYKFDCDFDGWETNPDQDESI
jgi:regulator of RNase E activity RraB